MRRLVTPMLHSTEFFESPIKDDDVHVSEAPPALPDIGAVATHDANAAAPFPS